MLRPIAIFAMLVAVGTMSSCASSHRSLNQLPAPVKATVSEHVGDGRVTEIEEKHHDGVRSYEIEYKLNSKGYQLKVDEQGKILSKED